MAETNKVTNSGLKGGANEEQWPGIDSRYRLIVVAALRSKQLQRGSSPRVEADARRHRNTSIAIEEVKRGLIAYKIIDEAEPSLAHPPRSLSGIGQIA